MFKEIKNLYNHMDNTWDKIADHYNFKCNACEDNCCRSLFFHHTYVEKAYLLHGFDKLEPFKQKTIQDRSEQYITKTFADSRDIKSLKIMCPLNEKGRCILYTYRPMICRLHGLPHELHIKGNKTIQGKGCGAGNFDDSSYILFDRTPFYRQMAEIEANWRRATGNTGKIKETVAHMIYCKV